MMATNDPTRITIFDEQVSRKPNRYPWTEKFIESMHNGFWTDKEFSFNSDVHQFKTVLTDQEREIIVRTLSAIGQIEVAVKTFWAKLGDNLPHPSLQDLGYVMANVEVIHNSAYERLLKILNLEDIFEENLKLDWIQGRVKYLKKYTHKFYKDSKKQYLYALILFTLFVENVSLFSQFYVINWFSRFKNVLKDTDQQVKYTRNEECYVQGTEILTPSGWRDISKMNIGDSVYQYNADGSIEMTTVKHTIAKDFRGELIQFTRSGNKCLVTPNHEMIYFNTKGKLIREKAKNLNIHKQLHIPIGGESSTSGQDNLSFYDRLQIVIQADGSNLYWTNTSGEKLLRGKDGGFTHSIRLTKDRKKDRLDWILGNLNLEYTVKQMDDREVEYKIRYNQNFDYKDLTSWIDLRDKSAQWCKEFVEEVIQWDGFLERSHSGYCSTNKANVDIVQTIAILAGYVTNIYKGNESSRNSNYKDCYKLSFVSKNLKPKSHAIVKETVPYSGDVYCVTVPSGNIITRLDDKTFIAGNCVHALVGVKIINTIREEYPELFDDELTNRIIDEAQEAFKAESKIIDWMVNGIDEPGLNAATLKEFIKNRINESLSQIGFQNAFDVDQDLLSTTMWFEEELLGNNMTDFFHGRPVEYSKKNQSFDEDELF
jgi:ribonucleotide reductase beta subunit family protein with ferritin-like domain